MKKVAVINQNQCDRSPFCPVKFSCPLGAITQVGQFFNASTPKVDDSKCIGCGKCVKSCPHGAVSLKTIQ